MANNPFAIDNTGSQGYANIMSGLGKDVTSATQSGGSFLTGLASAASPILSGVNAVTSIIDTVSNIFGQSDYERESRKNRELAMKQYEEQKAIEAEKERYGRGIAERNFKYLVNQNKKAENLAKKEDNYKKWLDFTKSFTNQINSNRVVRQNLINNYRKA